MREDHGDLKNKATRSILDNMLAAQSQNQAKDMKYDKGKLKANIPFEDFPDAIQELIKVCTFGAEKYSRSSWKTVPNGKTRYNDARARHFLGDGVDEESTYDHLAHEAWNCLAVLQLKIEASKQNPNVRKTATEIVQGTHYPNQFILSDGKAHQIPMMYQSGNNE